MLEESISPYEESTIAYLRQLVGNYEETMTLYGLVGDSQPNEKRFAMKGEFVINRISDIATLTME